MSEPHSLTGFSPVRRRCTAMHPTASRRGGFIPESDGTHTSKCPYISTCNHRRYRAISRDIGAYSGVERCIVQDAPFPEVEQ